MRKVYEDREESVPKGFVESFTWDDGETIWIVHEPEWCEDFMEEDDLDLSSWVPGPSLGEFRTEAEAYTFLATLTGGD